MPVQAAHLREGLEDEGRAKRREEAGGAAGGARPPRAAARAAAAAAGRGAQEQRELDKVHHVAALKVLPQQRVVQARLVLLRGQRPLLCQERLRACRR